MKIICTLFLLYSLLFLFCETALKAEEKTENKPDRWTPEELMKIARLDDINISPDGERIVYTVTRPVIKEKTDKFETFIHITDRKGNSRQLTYGKYNCTDPKWSPGGNLIAFITKRSGGNNIWLIRPDGGEAWQLTDAKTGVNSFIWSPEGSVIAFTMVDPLTKEEEGEKDGPKVVDGNEKMNHIWLVQVNENTGEPATAKRLTEGDFNVITSWMGNWGDWSPDGKKIVFTHKKGKGINAYPSADISTVDIETGEVKPLVATEAGEVSPHYSPDGKWIAFATTEKPPDYPVDFYIYVIPSESGNPLKLADTFNRHYTTILGWSSDSKYIYYPENIGTGTEFFAMPLDGSSPVNIISGETVMDRFTINKTSGTIGFVGQDTEEPEEIYITDLNTINPVKITGENANIPDYPLGKTETITWESTDGLEIEGLLTYPVNYEEGKKYPLLLIVHGGPSDVFQRDFLANRMAYPVAVFSSEGYLVLRCNIRGSDGYGSDFLKANVKDLGGMDYEDLMSGVDYVIHMGIADRDRLGVMGWSYGGYMAAWITTKTNRFKAASTGAGITDFISYQGTSDTQLLMEGYLGGPFWEDPELYIGRSPVFNIKEANTPTLILHGQSDTRVPPEQGYELYNALKAREVPVEMVVYPGTGHNPKSRPTVLLDIIKRNLDWFEKYVMGEETGEGKPE